MQLIQELERRAAALVAVLGPGWFVSEADRGESERNTSPDSALL